MLTDELIARRPSGRAGLADWYAEVFEAQRVEGLSASDLAALLEVTATNIYYWRRRLRELDGKPNAGAGAGPVPGLVRVEVRSREEVKRTEPPSSSLEVRLAHSRSIIVPSGFDSTGLQALVTALEGC